MSPCFPATSKAAKRAGTSRTAAARGALLVATAALAGCAVAPPTAACPEIALLRGFNVVVEADSVPADPPARVVVKVCQDGTCRTADVELIPGTDSVDQGCEGTGPDSVCSAAAVPNGTLVGTWATADFSPGPLTATVSATGFGPYKEALEGTEARSGTGACSQTAFQTTLRVSGGELTAAGDAAAPPD
jgi:hypothetical protein